MNRVVDQPVQRMTARRGLPNVARFANLLIRLKYGGISLAGIHVKPNFS